MMQYIERKTNEIWRIDFLIKTVRKFSILYFERQRRSVVVTFSAKMLSCIELLFLQYFVFS